MIELDRPIEILENCDQRIRHFFEPAADEKAPDRFVQFVIGKIDSSEGNAIRLRLPRGQPRDPIRMWIMPQRQMVVASQHVVQPILQRMRLKVPWDPATC